MRSLIRLIVRFHAFLIFIVFEIFSFILVVEYNQPHKSIFLNSSNIVSGNIFNSYNSFIEYLSLKQANFELAEENALLYRSYKPEILISEAFEEKTITTNEMQYRYIPAKVINNTINKKYNYLTLNKGKSDSIKPEMAVFSPSGVVGIVQNVSSKFSSVISLLNPNMRLSAKIKKNGYFGSINWDGTDFKIVSLNEIPSHVIVNEGDTIVTSGYSAIFPENLLIGTVSEVENEKTSNFHSIKVRLLASFKNLSYVYIIENKLFTEQRELENLSTND
ncbi:MAG: rod shape-determining protein MreC [Bacteroidetes bacterium]|nr:rod shape-determining protein MreC [Bacteroidota bacterium]MBT6685035.1 rod shape-determining protein MreC [Bacteroidota bacterium]MBT7143113.1 rod shape-determining protein MreC [Bacteroidota bacterium]MBT7491474.1 rod shape-determining protein MreC [Bacteroidota bacterium]